MRASWPPLARRLFRYEAPEPIVRCNRDGDCAEGGRGRGTTSRTIQPRGRSAWPGNTGGGVRMTGYRRHGAASPEVPRQVVLLAFGASSCAEVWPTTLAEEAT